MVCVSLCVACVQGFGISAPKKCLTGAVGGRSHDVLEKIGFTSRACVVLLTVPPFASIDILWVRSFRSCNCLCPRGHLLAAFFLQLGFCFVESPYTRHLRVRIRHFLRDMCSNRLRFCDMTLAPSTQAAQ